MARRRIPEGLQVWIEARRRFHLSHAQVQMARELGLNPKKLGKLDNADQESWKLPLPLFIERLYVERFGRPRPAVVITIEERARLREAKKTARRAAKRKVREAAAGPVAPVTAHQAAANGAIGDADDPSDQRGVRRGRAIGAK